MSNKASIFSWGETRTERNVSRWLFLIGLGSYTQINIGGYTAISELFLVLFLPINLLKNTNLLRKDGLMPFIGLLFLWIFGQLFTDFYVHNFFAAMIRGLIPPVGIMAALVTIYPLLKKYPDGFKWLLLGTAISGIISIFIFQRGCDVGIYAVQSGEMTAVEAIVGYKLFWVAKLNEWLGLPVKGWYQAVPGMWSVGIAWFLAIYGLASGGRSSFAVGAVSALFIMLGGRTREQMRGIKKHLPLVIIGLLAFMPLVKFAYKEAAIKGWMGEEEKTKFYQQAEGKSMLQTLMAGRGEFFIAFFAIKDHPLIGQGSYAMDYNQYQGQFIAEYGNNEDYEKYLERVKLFGDRTIPAHSHIACFWLWAGIPGLLPWIYIVALLGSTLFRRMHVIPQYFGYFALTIPGLFWAIFFSPFGNRINMGFLLAMCFLVRVVEKEQCKVRRF